jgi:hypothetical protein
MSKKVLDLGNGRRVIHLWLLLLAIAGIRACGGAAEAEDRLNVTTQWVAEKTGVERAKSTWDATFRGSAASATSKISNAAFASVFRFLDALDQTAAGLGTLTSNGIDRAKSAVEGGVSGALNPASGSQPTGTPGSTNGGGSGAR